MIEIICNKKSYSVNEGTTLIELIDIVEAANKKNIVGALVNNVPKWLYSPLYKNSTIKFVTPSNSFGHRIYLDSLTLILAKAINSTISNGYFIIEHSISNGYFLRIFDKKGAIGASVVNVIKEKMEQIIASNISFRSYTKPTPEVVEIMKQHGNNTASGILKYNKNFYTTYFELDGVIDYFLCGVVPSTLYVKNFDITPYYDGFLLRLPAIGNSNDEISPVVDMPKLYNTYKENWSIEHKARLSSISDLNKLNRDDARMLIQVTEAIHEKKIVRIADRVLSNKSIKVVLIAGPSSSGKTTFSKRLSTQFLASGVTPIALSLDNYFVNREMNPVDENGELDFESLYSLDLKRFYTDLERLIRGEKVETPIYDFETGKRSLKTIPMQIIGDEILVIEGTHALNPELTKTLPKEALFKIFVSALNTLSFNDHVCIPADDTRLLRRIIRDYKYRGYSAESTILRWPSVRRGEIKWIEPFQEEADAMFSSTLLFELAAVARQATPILMEVPHYSDAYPVANRLTELLSFINKIKFDDIPQTSLLREFLGGSGFRY